MDINSVLWHHKYVSKMVHELSLLLEKSDITTQDILPKEELVDSISLSSVFVCLLSHRSFVIEVKRQ